MAPTRTLYLLRHAKSSWEEVGLDDFERPLSQRGIRACAAIAEYLAEERINPEVILCSPAVRTRQTLELVGSSLETADGVATPKRLYGASPGEIMALVAALPSEARSAMVVGHNPGIQQTALQLAAEGERIDEVRLKFPTGGLAAIELEANDWADVVPGAGHLTRFVRPRELGAR